MLEIEIKLIWMVICSIVGGGFIGYYFGHQIGQEYALRKMKKAEEEVVERNIKEMEDINNDKIEGKISVEQEHEE